MAAYESYFTDVMKDLHTLKLEYEGIPTSYARLHELMMAIANADPYLAGCPPKARQLKTTFGKDILAFTQNNVFLPDDLDICEKAEYYFLDQLKTENISNSRWDSPIILTHEERAVAVYKRYHADTAYGLRSVPELNLHAGYIHDIELSDCKLHELEPLTTAWAMELSDAQQATVARPSVFMMPVAARKQLRSSLDSPSRQQALLGSHTTMVKLGDAALVSATEIISHDFLTYNGS